MGDTGLHCCAEQEGGKKQREGERCPILPPCSLSFSFSPLCPVCAGVTLPMAPAQPTVPLGPFGEGSKAPASFCRHGALQGRAELPGATDTHALWDVPPPGQLLCGALPPGYPSSQKLTGMVHVGEHRSIPPACGGTGRTSDTPTTVGQGSAMGMARGRRHSLSCPELCPWLWQGQTCWRNTWWRSATCASAWRSPSAPTTGSGSSWSAAWPPPARPVVRCCMGLGLLGARPLHTPLLTPWTTGHCGERLSTGCFHRMSQ